MGRGISIATEERGVSNVVAVTLLIGLALVGIIVILVTGFVTLGETSEQANLEVAEETMLQVDSTLEQDIDGNTTVSFPDDLEGDVSVSNDATYSLTLNDNAECTTGSRPLSSVEYEENGETVAYEGGGVFRMTESGATMVSPPDVTYNQGSLSLSFVEMEGDISTTNELQVQTNASRQRAHQYRLSRAVYTNASYNSAPRTIGYICSPDEAENATLRIENSQYASAWAQWARQNHDTSLVTVQPSGSVGPGDTVTITYPLQSTEAANFEVSDVTATRESGTDPVVVTATVTNTGGLRERVPVEFRYEGMTLTANPSIGGGESKQVEFTFNPDSGGPTGDGPMEVSVPSDTETAPLDINDPNAVPTVTLDDSAVPRTTAVGTAPAGADVTVENTGGMTAYEEVDMYVDGDLTETYDVGPVAPTTTEDVAVGGELPTGEVATYNVTFRSLVTPSERETIDPFTVGEGAYLRIQSVSPPFDVNDGETVTVEATIENSGGDSLDGTIDVSIENASSGNTVADTSESVSLNGTAEGAESEDISLDYTATDGIGSYTYRIETPNETRQGRFYVGAQDGPNLIVGGLNVSQSTVVQGNETTLEVQVNNTGSKTADQTVWLNNTQTGTTLRQTDRTVPATEGEEITWTVDTTNFDLGNNRLEISTDNVTLEQNIYVVESQDAFEVGDGEISTNTEINATITMEGAELEGSTDFYGDGDGPLEYTTPTEMTLVIENDSGDVRERTLWENVDTSGADVNHPIAEERMQDGGDDNPYTYDVTLEENSTLALYATSYYCDAAFTGFYDDINGDGEDEFIPTGWARGFTDSGVDHPDRVGSTDYDGYTCTDRDGEWLDISNETNPGNVVIRGDGDSVPNPVPASEYQLSLQDMIGNNRIDDGNLTLADGERIFLYELSNASASFEEADEGRGDPDYNDAIARFQVTSTTETVTEPSNLKITNYDVPARVDSGNDAQLSLTVGNDGGQEATSAIQVTFDGNTRTIGTVTLDGGETTTVTTLLDTGSKSGGQNYQWTANVTAAERAERNGFVYVGQPTRPFFQVSVVNGPSVVDTDDSPEAEINITNSGSVDDTQQVTLTAQADDGRTYTDSTTLTVDAKQTEETTLSLPDSRGNWTYDISTDNVTTGDLDLFVGRSNVYVPQNGGVNIGLQDYDTSSLIEREGGIDAMTFELRNNGTVGDEREVELNLMYDNGTQVDGFPDTTTKQIGNGDLTGLSPVPAYVTFDSADLEPGYYEYELIVYNDTAGEGVDARATGELYLRELSGGDSDSETGITIDSGTIRVE